MRLYYFTSMQYPSPYANRLQVLKMCDAFSNEIEVTLFAQRLRGITKEKLFKANNIANDFSIKIFAEPKMRPKSLWYALSLSRAASAAPPGTVFYAREPLLALWLVIFSRRFRRNFFYESHSLHRFPPLIYKFFLRFAKGIVVTNRFKKDILLEWGTPAGKVIVEPNALDLKRFAGVPDKYACRELLNLPRDKKIIAHVGSFVQENGIYEFAAAACLSKNPDYYFLIVGGRPEEVVALKQACTKENFDVRERVDYGTVPLYTEAADLLVAQYSATTEAARAQASPLKIPEDMYSERPIVASDVPMVREWLDKTNAYLVKPDDAKDLLRGIDEAFADKEEAHRRAHKARNDILNHTWDKRATRILDFFKL